MACMPMQQNVMNIVYVRNDGMVFKLSMMIQMSSLVNFLFDFQKLFYLKWLPFVLPCLKKMVRSLDKVFIPVAHLRPGYRHVVLRNQISIPVQSSSLFIYIRKDVHVDAENKELIDQLVSPTSVAQGVMKEQQQKHIKFKPLTEQRSQSVGDLDSIRNSLDDEMKTSIDNTTRLSNSPVQHHRPLTTEMNLLPVAHGKNNNRRHPSTPTIDANWYQNKLIASSPLYNNEHLAKELSLSEVEESKTFKRKLDAIEVKLRRSSLEFDKVYIDYNIVRKK